MHTHIKHRSFTGLASTAPASTHMLPSPGNRQQQQQQQQQAADLDAHRRASIAGDLGFCLNLSRYETRSELV